MERPATEIMINLGNPDLLKTLFLPNDAAWGWHRWSSSASRSRPIRFALIHPEQVTDLEARNEISRLTCVYLSGEAFFVERLSEGIGTIGAAFLAEAGGGADVRLQDERVREPARRRRLRAPKRRTR